MTTMKLNGQITAFVFVLAAACGGEESPPAGPARTDGLDSQEGRGRRGAAHEDPGPQLWHPEGGGSALGPSDRSVRSAGRAKRAERAKQLTKAGWLAAFAEVRTAPADATDCQQAWHAMVTTRQGMQKVWEGDSMGGPARDEFLEVCRHLPVGVQRCLGARYHAAHRAECQTSLRAFGNDRDDPAWLAALSGHPASERPPPPPGHPRGAVED